LSWDLPCFAFSLADHGLEEDWSAHQEGRELCDRTQETDLEVVVLVACVWERKQHQIASKEDRILEQQGRNNRSDNTDAVIQEEWRSSQVAVAQHLAASSTSRCNQEEHVAEVKA